MSVLRRLKALDAFPKIQDDFYSKTMSGGVITIVCSIVMAGLFLSELGSFLTTQKVHKLEVDTSRGENITLKVDVTFPRLPCDWISVIALDMSGRIQPEVDHDLNRQRLTSRGRPVSKEEKHEVGAIEGLPQHLDAKQPALPADYCGSCYGAQTSDGQCCNTCEDVRQAYSTKGWNMPDYEQIEQCKREGYIDKYLAHKNEGCHIWGDVVVAKVAGHLQLSVGQVYEQYGKIMHDLQPLRTAKIDISHTFDSFSFGDYYPGQVNALKGVGFDQRKITKENPQQQPGVFSYFMKVVPTSYTTKSGKTTHSNQYSVTEYYRPQDFNSMMLHSTPHGIYMFYELSAIKVNVEEASASFLHFATNVCAIVGGVFTVSGILDATLYHGQRLIRKKMEIGKFG